MKHLVLSTLLFVGLLLNLKAQSPQGFSYQAVARNSNGSTLPNANVSLRITLLQGSINGSSVYQETFATTTDAYGILNLNIGTGTTVSGSFTNINWGSGPYFVKVELDPKGGSSYELMGTSQLMSVPYALYAAKSGSSNNNGIPEYTQAQIDSLNPTSGMLVYNTTYQQLLFGTGTKWICNSSVMEPAIQSIAVSYNGYTLMVSPVDNAVNTVWTNPANPYDTLTTHATSTDGQVNTTLIVNKLGTDGGVAYAAKVCDTLTLGGYSDWYLPSKEELGAIVSIPNASNYFAPLFSSDYWSSTEYNNYYAWVDANGNISNSFSRYDSRSVRCVRKK